MVELKHLTAEELSDFLRELTELTNKYDTVIGGCGCCGSPWLDEKTKEGHYIFGDNWADSLEWST